MLLLQHKIVKKVLQNSYKMYNVSTMSLKHEFQFSTSTVLRSEHNAHRYTLAGTPTGWPKNRTIFVRFNFTKY